MSSTECEDLDDLQMAEIKNREKKKKNKKHATMKQIGEINIGESRQIIDVIQLSWKQKKKLCEIT